MSTLRAPLPLAADPAVPAREGLSALNRLRPEGLARLGAVLTDARAALRGEAAA